MTRKKIAVLFGGCSPEYNVSLSSAGSVVSNLDDELFDPILIGIKRDGNWYRYYGPAEKIAKDEWHLSEEDCVRVILAPDRDIHGILEYKDGKTVMSRIDAAFPVLHGKNGEDGSVQGLLELAGIPVVGCGILASALCMDKARSKQLVTGIGINSPKGFVIGKNDTDREILEKMGNLSYQVFVKPVNAGSSFGITKVYKEEDLSAAIRTAFEFDSEVIIEENVDGFEVGCAVIGNDELITGYVDEIELFVDWFDYHEKYSQKKSKIHTPARIDECLAGEIKEAAKKIYRALGCCGFARVDMFLTKEGKILFNEVNTIPGLTSISRFPKMMRGAGYEFSELLTKLIELGLLR